MSIDSVWPKSHGLKQKQGRVFGGQIRHRRSMQVQDNPVLVAIEDDDENDVGHGPHSNRLRRRKHPEKKSSKGGGSCRGLLQRLGLKRSVSDSTTKTVPLPGSSDKEDISDHSIAMIKDQKSTQKISPTSYQPPKVRFGETTFIEVPCWKDLPELWWSQSELERSRRNQILEVLSNESTRLYLNGYQDAHRQLTNGGDRALRLPPALVKGLDKGHAGVECFASTLEDHRRRRGREIVQTIVWSAGFMRDPGVLREQAVRLNAPSRQWAHTMGKAHEGAVKFALSVELLHCSY